MHKYSTKNKYTQSVPEKSTCNKCFTLANCTLVYCESLESSSMTSFICLH